MGILPDIMPLAEINWCNSGKRQRNNTQVRKGKRMARKRFVTRAITSLEVEYLGVDKVSRETFTGTESVVGNFSDEKKLLNAVKEKIETDTVAVVAILDTKEKTAYYIMPEDDFIRYAEKSETRFPVKEAKTETEVPTETETNESEEE